jgi:small subunit ribosomal protein S13
MAGVDIPRDKPVSIALTYIFGLGRALSKKLLTDADVTGSTRVRDLTEAQLGRIRDQIDRHYRVEGELRREVQTNIARLRDISSYRGMRHRASMPVRGQRTRTNARARKGGRRTVGIRKRIVKRG